MNRKYIFKALTIFVMLFAAGTTAQAQVEQSFFLNGVLPTGQFGEEVRLDGLNADVPFCPLTKVQAGKGAGIGLGVGYRVGYKFDVGFGYVTPYFNVDIFWNQLKTDYRDAFTMAACDKPNYFNIPIFVGINYRYDLTSIITVFGEFGLGPDFLLITREGWGIENNPMLQPLNIYNQCRYEPSTHFAWQVGAGSYFGEHVSLGIHYYGLGKHVINYSNIENELPVELRNIGMVALRIGFHL